MQPPSPYPASTCNAASSCRAPTRCEPCPASTRCRPNRIAPTGSALPGLSAGQSIAWQVPGGRKLQLSAPEGTSQGAVLRESAPGHRAADDTLTLRARHSGRGR
jgi:hypothetical protein